MNPLIWRPRAWLLSVFLLLLRWKLRSPPHPKRDETRTDGFPKNQGRPALTDDTWHQIRSHLHLQAPAQGLYCTVVLSVPTTRTELQGFVAQRLCTSRRHLVLHSRFRLKIPVLQFHDRWP
ncbi:hypothetical protein NA56DRAFT_639939 [Hyaloscypha hepaticicola]|uniref:Secreted protein n=1 Tax=Hyaloscypha hepaticicola TaxID=2082293 RepID=A0A2J6QPU2_9HELO|nr:hypothetical protein NA56DRAFT_639939 [Hyaloscypha hepaticicola]